MTEAVEQLVFEWIENSNSSTWGWSTEHSAMLLRCTCYCSVNEDEPYSLKYAMQGCQSQPTSGTAGLDALVADHKAHCEGSLQQLHSNGSETVMTFSCQS